MVDAAMESVVANAKVVVCVGPGGVGKTSTSAAIGMHAARRGRRVIVLTIDPAKRLANALGLPEIGNEERAIPASAFEAAGATAPEGQMSAMMLDIKRAWDDVVNKYHPDPEVRDRLLANRFYNALSTALAGSQEYMAMEKLYELSTRTEDPLDLIVLDTPPAASAVDFLDAPNRMLAALDNDGTRWLLEPYSARKRVTQKLFDAGSTFFIRTIGRFTGIETLQSLAEMLSGFAGMFEGFRTRARAVRAILGDDATRFVVVSAPRPGPIADARAFAERLIGDEIHVGAIVLNRATVDPFDHGEPLDLAGVESALDRCSGNAALAEPLVAEAHRAGGAAAAERGHAETLASEFNDIPVVTLPELSRDVHDLTSLETLRGYLFGSARVPFRSLVR